MSMTTYVGIASCPEQTMATKMPESSDQDKGAGARQLPQIPSLSLKAIAHARHTK
jgi:hypothetical protein